MRFKMNSSFSVFLFCSLVSHGLAHNKRLTANISSIPKSRHGRALSSYTFLQEDIPGTNLKSGTFYVLRMKRFPSGYVSFSTRKHGSGYNYMFVDDTPSHRVKYERNGPWHKDTQWTFLSSSEPGWYHLINRGIPCQYATWSAQEKIEGDGTFYLTLDPNYPGFHAEDDFLFKPYQPLEADDKNYFQLIIKSLKSAVISWNAGNTSGSQSFYIHVETTGDANWLKRYTWGHIWYDDTLFSFEPVKDDEEERSVEGEDNLMNEVQLSEQEQKFETLVGYPAENFSGGSILWENGATVIAVLIAFKSVLFYLNEFYEHGL